MGGVFIKRGGDLVQKVDVELTVDKETKNTVTTYIFSKFVHIIFARILSMAFELYSRRLKYDCIVLYKPALPTLLCGYSHGY